MNRIYRIVYNRALNQVQVAYECVASVRRTFAGISRVHCDTRYRGLWSTLAATVTLCTLGLLAGIPLTASAQDTHYTIDNGDVVTVPGHEPYPWDNPGFDLLIIGGESEGTLNVIDNGEGPGYVNIMGELMMGALWTGKGHLNMAGLGSHVYTEQTTVGRDGIGAITLSDGTQLYTHGSAAIGARQGAYGRISVHGGDHRPSVWEAVDTTLGDARTGIIQLDDGGAFTTSQMIAGREGGAGLLEMGAHTNATFHASAAFGQRSEGGLHVSGNDTTLHAPELIVGGYGSGWITIDDNVETFSAYSRTLILGEHEGAFGSMRMGGYGPAWLWLRSH